MPTQGDRFVLKLKKETFTDRVKGGPRPGVSSRNPCGRSPRRIRFGEVGGFPFFDSEARRQRQGCHPGQSGPRSVHQRERAGHRGLHGTGTPEHREPSGKARGSNWPITSANARNSAATSALPLSTKTKLVAATARQQEIVDALDLTKNQAGTQREDGSADDAGNLRDCAVGQEIRQGEQLGTAAHSTGDGSLATLEASRRRLGSGASGRLR